MPSNAGTSVLAVRAHPGAKRDELVRDDAGGWRARIAAPPVDGKANEHLCAFVARDVLGLPKRAVRLRSGAASRDKVLEIDLDTATLTAALAAWEARDA